VSRLVRLFAFSLTLMAVQPAFADRDHDNGHENDDEIHHPTQVPELSSHGAAAGFALIAGGAAVILGRRRSRRRV
jgi:hypothetical protein